MSYIPEKDQRTLKDRLRRELKRDVTIRLFTQRTAGLTIPGRECRYCDDTQRLLEELTGLSRKLHLEVMDFYSENQAAKDAAVERIPAIILTANGTSNVKFYGIPMGYEFTAILEGLVTLSRGVSPLSLDTRKKLKRIKADVHIKVFVTPNCGYSPQVARLAHAMAMDNPRIAADVVEVQEFPLLGQQYMVANVPRTVINDRVQFVGAVPESVFVDKVLEAVAAAPDGQKSATLAIAPELGPYTRPAASR